MLELLLEPVTCEQTAMRVELGLQEALVNAVRHGNGGDSGKWLRVRRILTPHCHVWQIQDEGEGLPIGSCRVPQRLDAARGRGLFLIQQCFDDVRWSRREIGFRWPAVNPYKSRLASAVRTTRIMPSPAR